MTLEDVDDIADAAFAADELVRLRRAVESTTDLITFHARGGRVLFANRAARELIGVDPAEPLPKLEIDEFFETTAEQLAEMRQAIMEHGAWSGELFVRGRDLRLPASVVVSGHRDANGRYEYFSAISRDISDQRANEAARQRSETALRAIVQSSPLPIFALDARGTVHVWNHAAEAVFGWTADDVLGGPLPFLDSPVELDALTALAFSGETTQAHEARYATRDGDLLDVSVSIAPLRNGAGRVVSAVVVIADVTDQRRAESALRESEVRFRSLVQDSSDMVTIVGSDGRVTYRSPSTRRFLGLGSDGGEDVPVDQGLYDEDRPILNTAYERLRANPGSSVTARYRFERHDGALRWLELIATDHRADDAVGGIVINCRDITERVEAEQSVRESEERMRVLLANISDAVSVIDGGGNLRYSSPTSERMFGYKEGEWPEGQHIFDTVHPDDRRRVFELWDGSLSTPGEFRPLEIRLRKADGSWIHVEVVANNLLDDPSINGIVVTSRDITHRKESEVALRESEGRLRESESRYRAVVDDQTELVCRYLPDATLTFTNRAFAEFFGSTSDELSGVRLVDLRPASEQLRTLESLKTFASVDAVRTHVEREVALDGSLRWYQWTDRAFANDAGEIVEFQSVGHDVTDQRRAAEFAVHQAEILEQVARGVELDETLSTIARALEDQFPRFSCAIMLIDEGDNGDARTGATLRTGVAPTLPARVFESLHGTPVAAGSGSSGAAAFLREPVYVQDVNNDERWGDRREILLAHGLRAAWSVPILAGDGITALGTLDVFVSEPRLPDEEHRQIFVLLAQLASIAIERKAFEERLAHQSMHDPLTGLPNRVLFLDRLDQAIARCRRSQSSVGVAFLDLDRFKNVNDSLGHDAGDELLIEVARKLESVIRPGDTVARFGGDEFVVLCEDLPPLTARKQTVEVAERLLANVIRPLVVRGTEMFVGASVGIAMATTGEERPDELLRDADAALFHAKDAGRGRVEVFDDAMRARALTAHATENALHRALERGEFRIFFQPIVSLSDARCVGAEALVRWQHPERGLLAPAEFIPLAEESGLIVQIGWWVLQEAARDAARWQLEQSEPFQVAVNLSARQLAEPDLADRVAEVIAETGVRPSSLCFEITESVLLDDAESVLDAIRRVRALGVQFAIDDFGTGYSSLGYLKQFPVDSVKVDRSFVSGLGADPGDAAIVSAVIGLAHALGLRVTAEGVETKEQLEVADRARM